MRVKLEDLVAVQMGEDLVCMNCLNDGELREATPDDLVDERELERSDDLVFCDRCKKRIN